MTLGDVVSLIAAFSALIMAYIAWRRAPIEHQSIASGVASNLAQVANMSLEQLAEKIRHIGELEKRQDEHEEEISDLKEAIKTRNEVVLGLERKVRKEIADRKLLKSQIEQIGNKYNRMKRVNEKLIEALEKAGIPLPDINGDLTDTLRGYKWSHGK